MTSLPLLPDSRPLLVNISYLRWTLGRRKRNEAIFHHLISSCGLFASGLFVNPVQVESSILRGCWQMREQQSHHSEVPPFYVSQPVIKGRNPLSELGAVAEDYVASITERYLKHERFVLWMNSAEPFAYEVAIRLLPGAVLRVFDLSDDFTTFFHSNPPAFARRLHELLDAADTVIYVNDHVKNKFPHRNGLVFGNGTEYDVFEKPNPNLELPPILPKASDSVYIGFAGGLVRERVDTMLLEFLITEFPSYRFIFAGYCTSATLRDTLAKYPNVTLLPELPYSALPSLIASFDVAIIPHVSNEFTAGNDLLKVHDYLAAGVPVVSTPASNVRKFGEVVHVCQDPLEFRREIARLVELRASWDGTRGRQTARMWSWSNRIADLAAWLDLRSPKGEALDPL